MISASSEFKNRVANGTAKYLAYIEITPIGGSTLYLDNSNIWQGSLSIEDAVSADSDFQIGTAIINKIRFSINNIYGTYSSYDFDGATVVVYIGQQITSSHLERLRKGTFLVDEANYDGSLITLECLDYMSKFNKSYSNSNLVYPASLSSIVQYACIDCGVTLSAYNFSHYNFVVSKPENADTLTYREVIAACAQIAGCFARCDTQGRLELKWYNQSALDTAKTAARNGTKSGYTNAHSIQRTFSHSISVDDVVITGVRITAKKKPTESDPSTVVTRQQGTNGYVVAMSNNPFITATNVDTILAWLATQIIGFSFRKASVSHIADPTIEAGDVAIVWDRNNHYYPIVVSKSVYGLGQAQNTVSAAQTPARNSAEQFSLETKNYVELRKDLLEEQTERELLRTNLTNSLNQKAGLYTHKETTQSGTIFYLHDQPELADSSVVWKMTAEAWGVTDHYNGANPSQTVWNAGMTVDGNTILNILSANGINAGWITAGTFEVKDSNNNVTFSANTQTGAVHINATSFSLSGQTISQIASNAAGSAVGGYDPADHLTQQEIFNILTGGDKTSPGSSQGIWLNNGLIYLNFSYAQGGTLKLGTRDGNYSDENSWGKLEIYRVGHKIAEINSSGITTYDDYGHKAVTISDSIAVYDNNGNVNYWVQEDGIYSVSNINFEIESVTKDIKILTFSSGDIILTPKWAYSSNHGYIRLNGNVTAETLSVSAGISCVNLSVTNPPWNSSSDLRLKKNIIYAKSQVNNVMNLPVRSFDWKDNSGHVEAGLVAQELKNVYPQLVKERTDGYLTIDYISMVPYLIKAIQEQQEEIEKLRKKVM